VSASASDAALLAALRAIVGEAHVLSGGDLPRYEVDWRKRYRGRALAVVRPGGTDEVAAVVRACAAVPGASLVPQGGNTGLVGGGVPDESGHEIVLSLERMTAVRRVDRDNLTMTVEAGCVLQAAQQAAAEHGLLLPLSLAAEGSCTIGGNLATNAGGTQVLRFGTARELCLGLEVVTARGEVWSALGGLRKDNTGYDLRDLFIGSEGTLGVITAATMKVFPQPRAVLTGWVATPSLDAALALLRRLRAEFDAELRAFEAMGAFALALTARHFPALPPPLAPPAPDGQGWQVLLELASPHDESLLRPKAEAVLEAALEAGEIVDAALAQSIAQARAMWQWRESIPLAQSADGLNIKHDIGMPTSAIPQFVREADAALEGLCAGARHVTFGHLGDGNLHYNLQAPAGVDAADFLARFEPQANRIVHDLVARFGGTMSAEHGIGRLKRDELAARKSPVALGMMREIRRALDPAGLFNPGKVIARG
jgi:FAD/FMN-containing dehydrogenase